MTNEIAGGVTVTGEASLSATPDIAKLAVGVSSLRANANDARDAAAASVQRMLDVLSSAGVAERDVQTHRLALTPEYDYDKGRQRQRGVRGTNTLAVTLRDLDGAGATIDSVLTAGGDDVVLHGIDFALEHPEAFTDEARRAAVADARRRAETLAASAGVALGMPTRIVEHGTEPAFPRPMMAMRAEAASAPTPVAPGQIEVTVRVEVTWAIT
jgi:uncharacterized protein YggE